MNKKDFYETLGIGKNATEAEIKSAFRKNAKKYHPDNKETGNEAKFKEIGEAYAILSDPQKKAQYDKYGHAAFDASAGPGGGFQGGFTYADIDLSSIFDDLFGGSFGSSFFGGRSGSTSRNKRPIKGDDSLVRMNLTFEEAAFGCEKELTLSLNETCSECDGKGGHGEKTCPTCNGRGVEIVEQRSMFGVFQSQTTCHTCGGRGSTFNSTCEKCRGKGQVKENKNITVKIPAGVDNGYQLRITEKGEAGRNGGPNGDIYIEFKVKDHPLFKRNNNDLYLDLPITITDATLGAKKEIPSLNGNLVVTIDEGSQAGEKLRIKGKGITDPNSGRNGDMYIILDIIVPKKLDKKQKQLLKELAGTDLESSSEFKAFNRFL